MTATPPDMAATLAERGARYGSWRTQAEIAQGIKVAYRLSPNWDRLPAYMRETLDINANKIARMLNGDHMYLDNWHDMTNYSRLAEDCLKEDIAAGVEPPVVRDPANLPFEERLATALKELEDLGFHYDVGAGGAILNEHEEPPHKVLMDYIEAATTGVPEWCASHDHPLPVRSRSVRDPAFFNDPVRAFFELQNREAPKT